MQAPKQGYTLTGAATALLVLLYPVSLFRLNWEVFLTDAPSQLIVQLF